MGMMEHDGGVPDAPLLLLTSWHLPRMRSMPRLFLAIRRLERDCRVSAGCLHVHRWGSRRSLMLASEWESEEAATSWLASLPQRRFNALAQSAGAEARVRLARQADR